MKVFSQFLQGITDGKKKKEFTLHFYYNARVFKMHIKKIKFMLKWQDWLLFI